MSPISPEVALVHHPSPKRRTLKHHSHAENELETEREPEDGF